MAKALTYAFRIIHIDNIPYVEKCGLVRAGSPLCDPGYVSIGDRSVIGVRASREIQGYRLNDYIPFYFGPRSPMLYVIQHGYNGVCRVEAEQIIYCIVRLDAIINSSKDCVFTDGHALSALTSFFDKEALRSIDTIISYDDVYSSHWISDTDLDLKRRKEAELLVRDDLEPQFVCGYVVYNEKSKRRLEDMGVPAKKIAVRPSYYF